MTKRSVTSAEFSLTRHLKAPPARVWQAYADAGRKRRWFADSGPSKTYEYTLDFREGGAEHWHGAFGDMPDIHMNAQYLDIVPEERIIIAYHMRINGERISASLQTTELRPEAGGTRIKLTEYGAYLDGHDTPEQRQLGTEMLLDELTREVEAG